MAETLDRQFDSTQPAGELNDALLQFGEKFARNFARSASGLLRMPVRVRLSDVAYTGNSEFLASLAEPTCCFLLAGAPAPGEVDALSGEGVWVEFSPSVAFGVITRLLGGADAAVPERLRPLTAVERKLLRRVVQVAAESLSEAISVASDMPLHIADDGAELQAVSPERSRDAVVVGFEVCMDSAGTMRLCMPKGVLQKFLSPAPPARRHQPVEVSASTGEMVLPLDELAGLSPGDVVTSDTSDDGEVIVHVAGVPRFVGRLVAMDGKTAVRITREIEAQEEN